MKIVKISILLLAIVLGSCSSKTEPEGAVFDPDADQVQVVLFHLEKRCASCNAVEKETRFVMENSFGEALEKGELSFVSMDFQNSEGKKAAKLLKASGQTLFVVRGDSIADLTSDAFMFAQTHPERYREALTEALKNMLD